MPSITYYCCSAVFSFAPFPFLLAPTTNSLRVVQMPSSPRGAERTTDIVHARCSKFASRTIAKRGRDEQEDEQSA
eukprot:scaffold225244_cov31-Tisochrysis_lutea.AAC.3